MRSAIRFVAGLVCTAVLCGPAYSSGTSKSNAQVASPALKPDADFGNIPLYFIPNRGQTDSRALFSARAEGFTLWATRVGLVFDLSGAVAPAVLDRSRLDPVQPVPARGRDHSVTSLVFLDARPDVEVSAEGETAHRANFFLGQDSARWRTDIPTSSTIRYRALYPGIDLKIYGVGRQVEYDWVISPGADPAGIRFRYDRARGTRLDAEGNLIVDSTAGELLHKKPAAYQDINGRRVDIPCRYERLDTDTYGFRVGRYDRRRPLVIDPLVLVWSSFIGGTREDEVRALAVDAEGAVWAVGQTESVDFPLAGPLDAVLGGESDIFVASITPAGNALHSSTFIGGRGIEYGFDLAVDPAGNPVVCGWTYSRNFPVRNAYDPTFSGGQTDGFLLKLSSSGNALLFSTFLGGRESDTARRLVLESTGTIVVSGVTNSTDFPAVKAFDKKYGGNLDVFVARFSADGGSLRFSTFLGGHDWDMVNGLALDAQGRIHVAGVTRSPDFPVKNALYPARSSGSDGFLTILASTGRALAASTFIGGRMNDTFFSLAVDATGFIYLGGESTSPDFPTLAAFDPVHNGKSDGIVLKLKPLASGIVYSTYLGGQNDDIVARLAVDTAGGVIVIGTTESPKFPVKNALDATLGGQSDIFITKFLPSGKGLAFSTFLGGSLEELSTGLFLDAGGDIYVYGKTESKNFPRKLAFDPVYGGRGDGFITKLRWR